MFSTFIAPRHLLIHHDGFQSGAKHQVFDLEKGRQETFETDRDPYAIPYKGLMVFKTDSPAVFSLELDFDSRPDSSRPDRIHQARPRQ
jgi:hypothetical protein